MQTKFMKPESDWTPEVWADYDETFAYCRANGKELRDYGDYFEVYTPTLEDLKRHKKNEVAADRFIRETSGITINGLTVATDRDSQALITGAALAAMLDGDYELNWKGESGFIHLTAEQILSVANAVRAHVQRCFDRESELVALVDAAQNAKELDEIIISWPI